MESVESIGKSSEGSFHSRSRSSESLESTIVIIDDEDSIRKSLTRLIQSAAYKVESFPSAAEFLGTPLEHASCVVCDLRMPGIDGFQLQQLLQGKAPFLSIIFISGQADIAASVCAMKNGAVDFLEKPVRRNALLEAIASAIERTESARTAAARIDQLKLHYDYLTPREREVFALVSVGLLNKQVAAQLGAAEKTVKQHRGAIMRKMGADSFADLVLMADRMGIRPTDANFAEAKGRLSMGARS